MKILTKKIEKAFAKQGYTGNKSAKDIKIVLKLFCAIGTWYLYEKENNDIYWGYVNLNDPDMSECGIVSMQDLMSLRIPPFGLGIERDKFFEPLSMSLEEVRNIVESGGHV